jgi:hypothetical protein
MEIQEILASEEGITPQVTPGKEYSKKSDSEILFD